MAQSLLERDGVEFATQRDLYGWDAPGVQLNLASRPAEFLVRESDADTARQLLADLRSQTDND